jgi:hypothetical protein
MKVYCNYHNQYGTCIQEDWYNAVDGRNPSRMVRVQFETFTQSVPLNTLQPDILSKYYLPEDATLVNHEEGTNGVDCWFDSFKKGVCFRSHRALSFEDFETLKLGMMEDLKNECELNGLENQTPEC